MKIGLFDSGLGGLTILKAVSRSLPDFDYEFYGDTKNVPYGDKSEAKISELTKAGIEYLFEKDCLLVLIACNTSSSQALRPIQEHFLKDEKYADRKILSIIIPTVEEVAEMQYKKVLLIATKRTVDSGKYKAELKTANPSIALTSVATPTLVPKIESGQTKEALEDACAVIDKEAGVDAVILGCTHYNVLAEDLRKHYEAKKIFFFEQDKIIPKKLLAYLKNHPEIETRLSKNREKNIHLTENHSRYDNIISELLSY